MEGMGILNEVTSALDSKRSQIHLHGRELRVLKGPDEYYREIRAQLQRAKRHVALSALYLGTGDLELRLIKDLDDLLDREPDVKVTFIFDFNRAHRMWRSDDSSNKEVPQYYMLLPLLRKYGEQRVALRLYEPPTNVFKQRMPQQVKETLGVYHVKFGMFDDTTILTGANLSEEYFINRQDRYLVVPRGRMTPFFERFVSSLSKLCYQANTDGSLSPPKLSHENSQSSILEVLTSTQSVTQDDGGNFDADTVVVPFMQHAPVGIEQESQLLPRLLQYLARVNTTDAGHPASPLRCASLVVSSPYPSFRQDLTDCVTNAAWTISSAHPTTVSKTTTAVISADTTAHGFGGERGLGVKALIPKLHDHIMAESLVASLDRIKATKAARNGTHEVEPVVAMKYCREGWSFHSKGIWAELKRREGDSGGDFHDAAASITYVGSSNMGERSLCRDMELGFVVVTQNKALQTALQEEVARILKYTQKVPVKQLYAPTIPTGSWLHSSRSIALLSRLFRSVL